MTDYEVELKFRLLGNLDSVLEQIREWGATSFGQSFQADTYFAHPSRDFAVTDEAFRIRRQGDSNWLTYKGPLLDRQTKSRKEIEVAFAQGVHEYQNMVAMLKSLGFREVASVRKQREEWRLDWECRTVHIALDSVEGVGEYIELELLSHELDWQAARDSLLRLADTLALRNTERRSYLQLLLETGLPELPTRPEAD